MSSGSPTRLEVLSWENRFSDFPCPYLSALLMGRRLDHLDILVLYLDGIVVAGHHIVAAVGVDGEGRKHLLGLSQGASENARAVKDLLTDLIARGLDPAAARLYVIDGSKALRSAIEEMFGDSARVQRCCTHKVRNVTEQLPKEIAAQVKSVMHAAYQLPEKEGMAKLRHQASWLKTRLPGRGGEPAGGAGRDLHGQSPEAHAAAHALPGDNQHHREPERRGAPGNAPRVSLPGRADGAALDGRRLPGGGEIVPPPPGLQRPLGAGYRAGQKRDAR